MEKRETIKSEQNLQIATTPGLRASAVATSGEFFDQASRFGGTFPPSRRASESPIAIACLRLLTLLPDLPDFNLPCFISRIARSTFCDALLPDFFLPDFVAIVVPSF
jgi:hypothetical protein